VSDLASPVVPAAPVIDRESLAQFEIISREVQRRLCESHPAFLLERVQAVDATSGEVFRFCLLTEDERADAKGFGWSDRDYGWFWQRELLDEWLTSGKHVALKARQLGVTWLSGGLALWLLLFQPGSKVLAVSIKESEAVKLVQRVWEMLQSLPEWLWNGARVLKPSRGARPTTEIQLVFPDGRISSIEGLTSSPSAGHGVTAALVILDEFSRQEYASDTWKAVLPTTQGGGRVLVISTGNGVSDSRGGGNFFHHVWVNADSMGVSKRFLAWDMHPDRDEAWYRAHAMALPAADRGEQYPRDEDEAFILTGRPYFDRESLAWYRAEGLREPLFRMDFVQTGSAAKLLRSPDGYWSVFREPEPGRKYGIGADVATGRGADFSAAYVIDLADMGVCAEFHAKIAADKYAETLHFAGRWFNSAVIAVESAGGFGEAVIIALRDRTAGRPAYPNLYRHVFSSRPDQPVVKNFGFPMNSKTRPLVIAGVEAAIRDRSVPFLTDGLLSELRTFVHRNSNPSPAAQDGTNDDRVMAFAVGLEMFRLFGEHPSKPRGRKSVRKYQTLSELKGVG